MKLQEDTLHPYRQGGLDSVLFRILRSHPTRPEVNRVEGILSLLVAANTCLDEWNRLVRSEETTVPEFLEVHRRSKASERAYYDAMERLNIALKRYHWRSAISGDINGFREKLEWEGQSFSERNKPKTEYFHWEYAIVRMLLDRTKEPGELSRFRRCSDCQNWFYAVTSHQRFCGETCRRHYTARSPEFKEKRRNYMKQVYRPQQKQRDLRSLSLAKSAVRRKGGN
jgi:hypothetical protein